MKIRMVATVAGPNGAAKAGTILEMADKAASELVAGGYAVSLEPTKPEAHKPPARKAAKKE